jgi:diguanylate cyclase (GGDEF)-like protein
VNPSDPFKSVADIPPADAAVESPQALALSILDGLDAAVYVSDMQTFELLYVNEYTRRAFGDVVGQRCWASLQEGQNGPCSFCTNNRLVDADGEPTGPYRWEFHNTRTDNWYQIVDRAIRWDDGRLVRLEIALDITERKLREHAIAHQASHDSLTGLLNRRELQDALERVHAAAERRDGVYALLLFDLDRFKLINDCYGHHVGDEVLKQVAEASTHCIRKGDWLGRWGGEEFLCILPGATPTEALNIAERLRRDIEQLSIDVEGRTLSISTSVGIASYPDDAGTVEGLLSNADSALYEAKRAGRNRVWVSRAGGTGIFSIAGRLEEALRQGLVRPAYQPIVELGSGDVVAEEALARIVFRPDAVLEAARFIEAASDLQLAHRIDSLVIGQTISRCTVQTLGGRVVKHFVNASADLLRHPERVENIVEQAYAACGACGDQVGPEKPLVIEITEREFLGDTKRVREILGPLTDFGLTIAIDDFGSGYSSFQYLVDLPVSYLKLEGSLVRRAKHERAVCAILRGIQDIANDLGLVTVGEQIEDEETLDVLREIGVAWGQGYLFGKPELDGPRVAL